MEWGLLALAVTLPALVADATAASPDAAGSDFSSAIMMPETGRLGAVRRFDAVGTSKDVVLLVSDADGWDSRAEDVAIAAAASGRTVLGIDLKAFQAGMDKTDDTCSFPVNDLEAVSQQVQKDLPFSQYHPPALVGIGAGAALAYASVTESLPGTFSAGIGLDFCPVYLAPRPFCPDAPTTTSDEGGGRYRFGAAEQAQIPWTATAKAGCPADLMDGVMDHTPNAVRLDARPARWGEAVTEALDRIAGADAASGIADIPLVEIPGEAGKAGNSAGADTLAIFWSGDGGWRDIDREIGQELARSGMPVVGVEFPAVFLARAAPRGHRP